MDDEQSKSGFETSLINEELRQRIWYVLVNHLGRGFDVRDVLNAIMVEITKTHDLVERCDHPNAFSVWDCEECFEESYRRMVKEQRERMEREGKVRRFRLVEYTKKEEVNDED